MSVFVHAQGIHIWFEKETLLLIFPVLTISSSNVRKTYYRLKIWASGCCLSIVNSKVTVFFTLHWDHFCSRVAFEKTKLLMIWFHKFTICNIECLDEKWTTNSLKCPSCKNNLQNSGTVFSWTFRSKSCLWNHNVFMKG